MKYTLKNLKVNFGVDNGDNSVITGAKNELHGELLIEELEIEYSAEEFKELIGVAKDAISIIKELRNL